MYSHTSFTKTVQFLLPFCALTTILIFLPTTPNYFSTIKQLILIFTVAALAIAWAFSLVTSQQAAVVKSRLTLPLIAFIVAIAANFFVNQEGWFEAAAGRGSVYIASAVLSLFALMIPNTSRTKKFIIYTVAGSAFLLACHSLLQLTVLYKIDAFPQYMNLRSFTPTGSPLNTLTLLLIGAAATFLYAARVLRGSSQYLGFVAGTMQTIAAVAYISLLLPGNELSPLLLPYQASWAVTLDALKSPKSVLFGIGLANFPSLFAAVKPLYLNMGPLWNALPQSATSELLQLLATTGIVGLGTFLLIPFVALSNKDKKDSDTYVVQLIAILCLVALFLTPASIPVLVVYFISLGLLVPREETHAYPASVTNRWIITSAICVVAAAISLYGVRLYAAEHHMHKAQSALLGNNGKAVYDEHLAAIKLAPAMSNYRSSYAQVNLSLASALSQKSDLSDSEREQVATLIQQAIREGKIAANLRPSDARVWQNLGVIYRNLINVAEGADQFAVSAYAQAVALDPANPVLRVELGGLLFQLANAAKEDEAKNAYLLRAGQEFQTAVQLKSDYANAYYNLSKVLESAGNIQGAYAAMQKAVASLDPSSADLSQATSEMETLKGKLPKPAASPSASPAPSGAAKNSEISTPSPLPSPLPGGPIDIPEETASPLPSPAPTE